MSDRPKVTKADIVALHAAYVAATNMAVRLDDQRERMCYDFLAAGWTAEQLTIVARYIQKGIGKGERNQGALKISNLIGMLDKFEEDLLLAQKPVRTRPAPTVVEKRVVTSEGIISRQDLHDPAATAEAKPAGGELASALRAFSEQLEKGGQG